MDMWVQGNGMLSLLTMDGLTSGTPIGMLWAGGSDVAPCLAVMALLAHMDMQENVGVGHPYSCGASVEMGVELFFNFIEVLFLFLFTLLEALASTKRERYYIAYGAAMLQNACVEGGLSDLSFERVGELCIGKVGAGGTIGHEILNDISIMGEETS
jgi:hypothetical protein